MPYDVHPDRYSTTGVITPKRGVVVHTSETGEQSLDALLSIMSRPGDRVLEGSDPPRMYGSAYHALADGATGEYVQVLPGTAGPYAAAGANKDFWNVCIPGRVSQTREEWLDTWSRRQIKAVARFIVDKAKADGFPLTRLDVPTLAAGGKGYCGHRDVSLAYGRSNHTDPYPNFPWDVLEADIRALTAPVTPPVTPPTYIPLEDNMQLVEPNQRIYDSRNTGQGRFLPNTPRTVVVKKGASAAGINVSVTAQDGGGFVRAYGGVEPVTATTNFGPRDSGGTDGNFAIVKLDANGAIKVEASVACHVIIDLQAVWP